MSSGGHFCLCEIALRQGSYFQHCNVDVLGYDVHLRVLDTQKELKMRCTLMETCQVTEGLLIHGHQAKYRVKQQQKKLNHHFLRMYYVCVESLILIVFFLVV